ncbi:MAG: hypothetical protein PHD39_10925 [Methylobacter tundripaludum]|nr:hypothetical protein [Methylobacter tundripaludum]
MHLRRYYLEALRTQLKTLAGFAGVWIQRIGPTRNSFPCITLYASQETNETLLIHPPPRAQDRVLTVSVCAWIRGTVDDEKAESDMDEAARLIESIMTIPANSDDIVLIATDFTVAEDEPEIHVVTLTYNLHYHSTEFTPVIEQP